MDKLIFIVDDEQAISKLLSYWAKDKWKYQVETFSNAEDALKNLTKKPDVVLLDIMLPGMDGIETLRRIKKIDPLLEVILLTGHASVEAGGDGMKYGAYDYVIKPCNVNDLMAKVEDAFRRRMIEKEHVQEKQE